MNLAAKLAAALCFGSLIGSACSREALEVEDHLDGTPWCDGHCELRVACGWSDDEASCFEECMQDPLAEGWDGPCNDLLADYYDCTNPLTCEELAIDQPMYGAPEPNRPCDEPRMEYSICVSEYIYR